MKKRFLALVLAVLALLCAALPASAVILSGYTSKVDYDNIDPDRYLIEIDLTNQIISVYEKDLSGAYSILVLEGLCTTGNEENPTGAGTYKLGDLKERFGYFVAYGQYAQYWTQVVRGIYIHSVMYDSKKLSSMSKSAYRNLGKACSHGCIRVLPEVAQWIFYNCPPGTTCKITSSRAADPARVNSIKKGMASYSDYRHPSDSKADPAIIPGVIRYDKTPLRTGFSNSRDETVALLSAGDPVDLLQIGRDWVKVRAQSGKLGYVKTDYVLCYPDAPVSTATVYKATAKTYVYASDSTGSQRLISIPKGSIVTVEANPVKGWYTGSYDGVSGYLRTKYVKPQSSMVYPTLSGGSSAGGNVAQMAQVRSDIRASFRDAPTTSGSNVLLVLDPNTPLTLISVSGNWYYACVNGVYGYIYSSCVDNIH